MYLPYVPVLIALEQSIRQPGKAFMSWGLKNLSKLVNLKGSLQMPPCLPYINCPLLLKLATTVSPDTTHRVTGYFHLEL